MTTKPTKLRIPTRQEARREARLRRLEARERFKVAKKTTRQYERSLVTVAKHIGRLVQTMAPKGEVEDVPGLTTMLRNYAQILRPWATAVAKQMVEEANQHNQKSWENLADEMGQNLRSELKTAPVGTRYKELMEQQVDLITSLPTKAAERIHRLVTIGLSESTRAAEIAEAITNTGRVTQARAMCIARTETARAASVLTQARAEHIGATQYIWRTAGDSDVREAHKKLEGKVFSWEDPPVAGESGEKANPGCIYNCRCFPEPILPDVIED